MDWRQLTDLAKEVRLPRKLSDSSEAGSVAAAILTDRGNVYRGVCIDTPSALGFCAEHAAIAAMITAGESRVVQLVAVGEDGPMPPCGRCREFLYQIDKGNLDCEILLRDKVVTLNDLLPERWN